MRVNDLLPATPTTVRLAVASRRWPVRRWTSNCALAAVIYLVLDARSLQRTRILLQQIRLSSLLNASVDSLLGHAHLIEQPEIVHQHTPVANTCARPCSKST